MAIFKYVAKDSTSGKTVSATLEAENEAGVVDLLRKRDLIIISIEEAKKAKVSFGKSSKGVKLDELVIFSRQLATMVDSGIPLVQALDILAEQAEKSELRSVVETVRDSIESGSSLSAALAKFPNVFSALYINMVKAGESSGMLDEILERLAGYLEKSSSLQRKVKSSLIYPTLVIIMAICITSVLLLYVVPTFRGIFESIGGELPTITQILLAISDILRKAFVFIAGILVLFGFGFSRYLRTDKGRTQHDRFLLRMPIFGVLMRKVAVARFSRTLATLVRSGVPILGSLEIVGKTSGNKVVEKAVEGVRTSIREGENIAEPLAKSGVFPPMVTRMIGVGEQAGELEKMLTKIADFYEDQVDAAVAGLASALEPVIIIFLGVVVGFIVIAMFLPIFKLPAMVSQM